MIMNLFLFKHSMCQLSKLFQSIYLRKFIAKYKSVKFSPKIHYLQRINDPNFCSSSGLINETNKRTIEFFVRSVIF